jgi:hypothetical protein
MIITEDAYLAHYGVKGMKWGQRKAQAGSAARATGRGALRGAKVAGRVGWAGTKMAGRGTKRAAIWSKNNPKAAATIAAGALIAGAMLRGKMQNRKLTAIRSSTTRTKGLTRIAKMDLNNTLVAKLPNGKTNFYGREAEAAFRKAGAFR